MKYATCRVSVVASASSSGVSRCCRTRSVLSRVQGPARYPNQYVARPIRKPESTRYNIATLNYSNSTRNKLIKFLTVNNPTPRSVLDS